MQITFHVLDLKQATAVAEVIHRVHPEILAIVSPTVEEKPPTKPRKSKKAAEKGNGTETPAPAEVEGPTFDVVREAAKSVMDNKSREAAMELLRKHGAPAGVSSLPEASWAAFVAEAQAQVDG